MRFCLELILGAAVLGTSGRLPACRLDRREALPRRRVARSGWCSVDYPHRQAGAELWCAATARSRRSSERSRAWLTRPRKISTSVRLLVDSVIQVESNYNPFAVSPKGAQGLMQLMPATAQRFGVTDSFDPKQNIEGGVRYLKFRKIRSRTTGWRLRPTTPARRRWRNTATCRPIRRP